MEYDHKFNLEDGRNVGIKYLDPRPTEMGWNRFEVYVNGELYKEHPCDRDPTFLVCDKRFKHSSGWNNRSIEDGIRKMLETKEPVEKLG